MASTSIRINPASLRFTILAIGNQRVSLRQASRTAVRAAGLVFRDAALRNISLTDHTLDDLRKLDHPYARRHGSIQIHAGGGGGWILDGRQQVHRQSGNMVRALKAAERTGPTIAYDVWLDVAGAPEIRDVLQGTRRMLPRDPLWQTALAPKTIEEMRRAILSALGKSLRSQAVVRFSP